MRKKIKNLKKKQKKNANFNFLTMLKNQIFFFSFLSFHNLIFNFSAAHQNRLHIRSLLDAPPPHQLRILLLPLPRPWHLYPLRPLPPQLRLRAQRWPQRPQLRLLRLLQCPLRPPCPSLRHPTAASGRSTVAARCGWSLSPFETSPGGRRSPLTTAWPSGERTW